MRSLGVRRLAKRKISGRSDEDVAHIEGGQADAEKAVYRLDPGDAGEFHEKAHVAEENYKERPMEHEAEEPEVAVGAVDQLLVPFHLHPVILP